MRTLHATAGNRVTGRWLQAKLKIGLAHDEYEQEADHVADQVMRMADPAVARSAAPATIQRKCNNCEEELDRSQAAIQRKCSQCEEEERVAAPQIQRKCENCGQEAGHTPQAGSIAPGSGPVTAKLETRIERSRGGGEPLSAELRSFFEPRMASDFSGVRVHTNAEAAETASALDALAFTTGRNIFFAAGNYSPGTVEGKRLLAHELTHVAQQGGARGTVMRSTGSAPSGSSGVPATATSGGAPAPAAPNRIAVDVLTAGSTDDNLVRAASENLGVDIRVSSMANMIDQLEHMTAGNACLSRLSIFNHANPSWQLVAGGSHSTKAQPAGAAPVHDEGFSLSWLTNSANQTNLNRLRHAFCCSPAVNWYGCATAGVWAAGDERTPDEQRQSSERYTGTFGHFYHDVAEAAAHGATSFQFIGPVNVQSWSNALCSTVYAATDFNNWRPTGSGVVRTVIYGGQMMTYWPEQSMNCSCDTANGRLAGTAPTSAQLSQHATELREQALHPLYEQTRSALGTSVTPPAETTEQRTTREQFEQEQAGFFAEVGRNIREAVLEHAGFANGTQPTNADEALRVTAMWGLDIDHIVANLGTLSTSMAGRTTRATAESLDQQQRSLEAALNPRGRETFMSALRSVRGEHFWNQHLQTHTIYIFPDLGGVNRYRGYTQHSSQPTASGQTVDVWVIHISKDLLEAGETELAATSIVHELSHTLDTNVLERSMQPFERELVDLLLDHPRIAALRTGAADPAAARQEHAQLLRQMIYESTGYAGGEIFVHLQQLSHQPDMTVNGQGVRGSDYILDQVAFWMHRIACIGLRPQFLAGLLGSIRRRVLLTYDNRIAAAPAGSTERRRLELDRQLAEAIWAPALTEAQSIRCQP